MSERERIVREAVEAERERCMGVLTDIATRAYVQGCREAQQFDCLGWEAKTQAGTFGPSEFQAHKRMNLEFGKHFGIHAGIKAIREGVSRPKPLDSAGRVGDNG